MICVSKILGEVYDLVSNQEAGCGIVLTNGAQDVTIRISADDMMKIVNLHAHTPHGQVTVEESKSEGWVNGAAESRSSTQESATPPVDPFEDPEMGVGSL